MTAPAKRTRKARAEADKPRRDPSESERKAIDAALAGQGARPARARITVASFKDRTVALEMPHSDGAGAQALLRETFGTRSNAFTDHSLQQLANGLVAGEEVTTRHYEAGLALMGAIAPRDELEAAIGLQIVATHTASLDLMQRARANAGKYVESAAAYTNMATKLSRTMAAHVETLAKLRSGGKQTHEVRYVYVNGPAAFGPGAKAAAAYGGGGGQFGNAEQSHAAPQLAHFGGQLCPPVWSENAEGDALSVPGGGGPEALPDARGDQPGRAPGEG